MSDRPAKQVKRDQQADFIRHEQALDLRHVVSTPRGRALLWRILGMCRMNELSFAGENPLTMAFNEGRRSVANQILAELNEAAPDAFLLMLHEQQRKESAEQADDKPREETESDG